MRTMIKNHKVIGIVGSRRRNTPQDKLALLEEFKKIYENGDKICSGGCKQGGDRFAEEIAKTLGLTEENGGLIIHRPRKVPKGSPYWVHVEAFHDRNSLIAEECDILLAVVADDRKGGADNTVTKAKKFKREVILVQ